MVAVISAYSNSVQTPFLYDDGAAIEHNIAIRSFLRPMDVLFPGSETSIAGRPVVSVSFALNYALTGGAAWGFHLGNILIQCLAAFGMFELARLTLLRPRRDSVVPFADGIAVIFALLWALHPLATECVTYLTQRAEALMGLFCLMTLWGFAKATSNDTPRVGWLVFSGICSALAMMCKEAAVGLPLIVAAYDWVFVAAPGKPLGNWRRAYYAGLVLSWLPLAAIMMTGPRTLSVGFGFAGMGPWEYFRIQCQAIPYYLEQILWPSSLAFDYAWPVPPHWWQWVPQALALTLAAVFSLWALWRRRVVGFLGVAFFVLLAPTSSFVPIATEPVSEHRLYLPMACVLAGIFFGALAGVLRLGKKSGLPEIRTALLFGGAMVIGVLALGLATYQRNKDYASVYALWMDAARKGPANARAWLNAGTALWEEQHDAQGAAALMAKAIEIAPYDVKAVFSLGSLLARTGEYQKALPWLVEVTKMDPRWPDGWVNLGYCLGRCGNPEGARAAYERALLLNPAHAGAHFLMAELAERSGDLAAARSHLEQCLKTDPDFREARNRLGRLNGL